jgi:hypothetical protein
MACLVELVGESTYCTLDRRQGWCSCQASKAVWTGFAEGLADFVLIITDRAGDGHVNGCWTIVADGAIGTGSKKLNKW